MPGIEIIVLFRDAKNKMNKINEIGVLKFFITLYLLLNLTLFLLRSIDASWWAFDYSIYDETEFILHSKAVAFFCFYIFIMGSIVYYYIIKNKSKSIITRNSRPVFFLIVMLYMVQIYLAFNGVGIAGGVGKAPMWALVFLIFSIDGLFYAYALKEKNSKRLAISGAFFIVSNIIRGWAGFVIPAALLYILRRGEIKKTTLIKIMLVGLFLMPFLFIVRDYFRDGYSHFQMLVDSGYFGFGLIFEYIDVFVKLMLSRFDLYSHYIGVGYFFENGVSAEICNPLKENIFYKIYAFVIDGFDCKPLGGVLPGMLYDFFLDKGTSYSISSGFFALPFIDILFYAFPYIIVLVVTCYIFFTRIKIKEYSIFLIFFIMVLLVQGWMYQYVYNVLGFMFGVYILRVRMVEASN